MITLSLWLMENLSKARFDGARIVMLELGSESWATSEGCFWRAETKEVVVGEDERTSRRVLSVGCGGECLCESRNCRRVSSMVPKFDSLMMGAD